jgi:hypothetical protein
MKEERIEGSFTRVIVFGCSENASGSGRLILIINEYYSLRKASL